MLLDQVKAQPFPILGREVGDFVLYDTLLAGTAESAVALKFVKLDDIPIPDAGTVDCINTLKARPSLSTDEDDFIKYFELLANLRDAIAAACTNA